MSKQIPDEELARKRREQNRKDSKAWQDRANAYARSQGYKSYTALITALVNGEVMLVRKDGKNE